MELTEEQKGRVRAWVEEGCGLSEIQRRLADEFGISMVYMDVRLLILDLGLELKDGQSGGDTEKSGQDSDAKQSSEDVTEDAAAAGGTEKSDLPGGVRVELDSLVRPGAIVSGTVIFSDGVSATWMLDQMGRLAIEPSQPGYHPSEEDNAQFVTELKEALAAKGF